MKLAHIVACSSNQAIGMNNKLPWHIPEDLKYFMNMTRGSYIIMGRKTLESLPKPLKNRSHVVVTRNKEYQSDFADVFHTIEEAIEFCQKDPHELKNEIIFVTGGETIYRQTQNQMDLLYITRIHQEYEGDTFYPEPDQEYFELDSRHRHHGSPAFSFEAYTNKKKLTLS